jgi:hypothetical protein
MGTNVSVDAVKRKILHCWESNLGHPARRLSLYHFLYMVFVVGK